MKNVESMHFYDHRYLKYNFHSLKLKNRLLLICFTCKYHIGISISLKNIRNSNIVIAKFKMF